MISPNRRGDTHSSLFTLVLLSSISAIMNCYLLNCKYFFPVLLFFANPLKLGDINEKEVLQK